MKGQTDKLDFVKINNFCSAKDNVKRMRKTNHRLVKYLQNKHLIKDTYPKYTGWAKVGFWLFI